MPVTKGIIMNVRCSNRNSVMATKRILIATGGSVTAEMSNRYSGFGQWLTQVWIAFMDESQQYGNYQEIAALAAIQQPALLVFVGDHRQTSGGLAKGRLAAANRQKLLQRPLLRALGAPGDYLAPAKLGSLIERLWPDASQTAESDLVCVLKRGQKLHQGIWTSQSRRKDLPISLSRIFDFFCSNALIALARSLCKCLLAVLITASEADAVTGFLVRGASQYDTIPRREKKNTATKPTQASNKTTKKQNKTTQKSTKTPQETKHHEVE